MAKGSKVMSRRGRPMTNDRPLCEGCSGPGHAAAFRVKHAQTSEHWRCLRAFRNLAMDAPVIVTGVALPSRWVVHRRALVIIARAARDVFAEEPAMDGGYVDLSVMPLDDELNVTTNLLARVTNERNSIERQWGDACAKVQAYVQKYGIGEPGDSVFDNLIADAERLRLQLMRKRCFDHGRVDDNDILRARVAELEAALRDLMSYTNQLEAIVYDPDSSDHDDEDHPAVAEACRALASRQLAELRMHHRAVLRPPCVGEGGRPWSEKEGKR